jgi:outer membrane protein TolC
LDLYFQVVLLRKQILLAQNTLALQEENLKKVERNFQLGLVSETDVWETRLEVGKQKELLLDSRFGLLQSEAALKQSLGMDLSEDLDLDDEIPELTLSESPEELLEKALLSNPGLRERALGLEREKLGLLISGVNYAPVVTTSLSLIPSYSPTRTDMSFGSSFSDFFDDGAGMTYNLSIGVKIPLYNGKKALSEREMSLAAQRTAALNLENQRIRVFQELQSLLLRKENIEEKVALLADNVALRQRRVEIEKQLQTLGKSTESGVKAAELDFDAKVIDLWAAEKDRFMNSLRIYALVGQDIGAMLLER